MFAADLNVNRLLTVKLYSTDKIKAVRYDGQYGKEVNSFKAVKLTICTIPAEMENIVNFKNCIVICFFLYAGLNFVPIFHTRFSSLEMNRHT